MGDLEKSVKALGIKHFKEVFMRDTLPPGKPNKTECGIVNLDSILSHGTHWTCYMKKGGNVFTLTATG